MMQINPKRPRMLGIILVAISLTLLTACVQNTQPKTPSFSSVLEYPPTPDWPKFISYVSPNPDDVAVGKKTWVWASFKLDEVAAHGEVLEPETMQGQVELLIDSKSLEAKLWPDSKLGEERIRVGGGFILSPGEHEATIRIRETSGETLEYSWRFTVFEDRPRLPDLPKEFQFVRPLSDSTITLQAYQEELLLPTYFPVGNDIQGGVCVGVIPGEIVEIGEFLDGDDIARKYSIVLDGASPGPFAQITGAQGLERIDLIDINSDQVVASYAGGHNYECWITDLALGEHEAMVRLEKASGEVIEYTWTFTIIE